MGFFGRGRSTTAKTTSGSFGKFTRDVPMSGTCGCGASVSGTGSVTTVLGESGTAEATVSHDCGRSVTVTGQY